MSEPTPLTERELIELCLRGDDDAWRALIARYQGLIYSVPRRMGLSPEDSADVFQRVCVLLYQRLSAIRDPSRLGGWLLTTAGREALRAARRARRDAAPEYPSPEDGDFQPFEPVDTRPLADEECADLERAQILRSALAELSERCQIILREFLREDGEANYRDIARRLDMPIGSIGPTRARCLARLRKLLAARGLEG
jgi:RNA polymerase sigma factor (sigma-70 family)